MPSQIQLKASCEMTLPLAECLGLLPSSVFPFPRPSPILLPRCCPGQIGGHDEENEGEAEGENGAKQDCEGEIDEGDGDGNNEGDDDGGEVSCHLRIVLAPIRRRCPCDLSKEGGVMNVQRSKQSGQQR